MPGLFEGIPPFAGMGIPSGQGLQAAFWDLTNKINAVSSTGLLASGTVTGATAQSQVFTNGITTNTQNGVQINPYGVAAGQTGEQRYYELSANGSNFRAFKAADALAANETYILPSVSPTAGQALVASAPVANVVTLSWGAAAETLAATLTAGNITGGSDIVISNADLVTDASGVIQMDFGSGAGWSVNTDTGAFLTPYLDVTPTIARMVGLAGGQVIMDNLSTNVLHNTEVEIGSALVTFTVSGSVNMTAVTGSVLLKNGTAGAVAIGNAVGNGHIYGANTVSIVTNGVEKWMVNSSGSLNPIIDNTYDIGNGTVNPRDITVSRNLITDNIVEKTAAGGILVSGTGALNVSMIGGVVTNLIASFGDLAVAPPNNNNINLTATGSGEINASSVGGIIVLTPDAGWTASTGTASKAGIDSNDVIYTVGALQNLARTVVAIQNTLMTKGYFTA